jgi:transposase
MLNITSDRVFVFLTPTDMRKSFNTLSAIVKNNNMNPLSGDLYVFTNKPRNKFKILVWEKGGYWICAKRLEEGIFAVPFTKIINSNENYLLEIDLTELRLLIEGIELRQIKKNKRFLA